MKSERIAWIDEVKGGGVYAVNINFTQYFIFWM